MGAVKAQPEAAMVSEAELKILGAVPFKKDLNQIALKNGEWRLDGIIYNDRNDWTVWLNGQQFTPQQLPMGIRIITVCSESVQVCLDEEGSPIKTLCLNQCVRLNA